MLQRSWGSEPPWRPRIISDKDSGTPDSANCSFNVSGGTTQAGFTAGNKLLTESTSLKFGGCKTQILKKFQL